MVHQKGFIDLDSNPKYIRVLFPHTNSGKYTSCIFCQFDSWKKVMLLICVFMMNCEVSRHCLIELAIFISFSVNFRVCQSIQEFTLSSCQSNCSLLFPSPESELLKGGKCVLFHVLSVVQPTPDICVLLNEYGLIWKRPVFLCHYTVTYQSPTFREETHFSLARLPGLLSLSCCASPLPEIKTSHLQEFGQCSNPCITSTSTEPDRQHLVNIL